MSIPPLLTVMTRTGADAPRAVSSSTGCMSFVSAKVPSVLVAKLISCPSALRTDWSCTMHPALFTSTCSGSPASLHPPANSFTDASDDTSQMCSVSAASGTFPRMRSIAAEPRSLLLHTMCTDALLLASASAAAYPMPVFAPVTTTFLPPMSTSSACGSKDLDAFTYPFFVKLR